MKILVTGGLGFIGRHLAGRLCADHSVVSLDIEPPDAGLPFQQSVGDIRSETSLQQLVEVPDVIFHLAAVSRISASFKDPKRTYEINVLGTLNVLEYSKKNNCRVVYAGSNAMYDANMYASPYVYTKWLAEKNCEFYHKLYGVPVAIGRLFNVYGPGENGTLIDAFAKQKECLRVSGNGLQRRDFTHVDDIVDGLIRLAYSDHFNCEIFDFGSGETHSVLEIAKLFSLPIVFEAQYSGDISTTLLAKTEPAKSLLGYEPKHNVLDYIRSLLTAEPE